MLLLTINISIAFTHRDSCRIKTRSTWRHRQETGYCQGRDTVRLGGPAEGGGSTEQEYGAEGWR